MAEIQRRIENIKVDLTKGAKPKSEAATPENGQVIPEGVKQVGDFGVIFEERPYQAPTPLFSARRRGTW